MKRFLLAVAIIGLTPLAGWSTERPVSIRGVRALGMGDAFTSVADDQNVFFYNPAGTVQRTGSLGTILELPITVGTDLLDAYDFIDQNEDKLTKFNDLTGSEQAALINKIEGTITPLNPHLGAGLPNFNYLSGPINDKVFWGLGAFGQVDARFKINPDLVPSIDYDVNVDAVVPVNIATRFNDVWKIPGRIGVGVNVKYVRRSQVKEERVSFLQLEDFKAPPLQSGAGVGADLGFLYQPNKRWNFGLSGIDVGGTSLKFEKIDAEKGFLARPTRTSSIPARWNLGTSWTPEQFTYWPGKGLRTGNRLTLAADVKDMFNHDSHVLFGSDMLPDTAWTHVYLGAEYRWWFLRFRGGSNQGYPAFGLGLDIPLLKIDYAYYSDELGLYAGTLKQSNHMITIALRFGSGKTEARDRVHNPGEKDKMEKSESSAPAAAEETPKQ